MSRSASRVTRAGWLTVVLGLAACETPAPAPIRPGPGGADAAILDACRQRANEIFDRQNRAEIFSTQQGTNIPLSGAYVGSSLTRGLSAQCGHDQLVRECVRTANITSGSTEVPVQDTPPPPASGSRR